MSKEKKPAKKVLSVICTVLTGLIIVLTAAILINMVVCRAKNKPVSFFGTAFAIVQTPSMEPYIMTGDLIVFKECNFNDVKVGDYIVFTAGDGFPSALKGQSIVHAVIEINGGEITTQGKNTVTNPNPDSDKVTAENLLGVCTYNSAGWGKVFGFIGRYGIFIILAVIALPLIISQILKIVRLSKEQSTTAVGGENSQSQGRQPCNDGGETQDTGRME